MPPSSAKFFRLLTRRDFLTALGATAAASTLGSVDVGAQSPAPPRNLHLASPRLITAGDFSFLGYFRLPMPRGIDYMFSRGAFAGRRVSGGVRLYFAASETGGSWARTLVEVSDPGTYHPECSQSPIAELAVDWGNQWNSDGDPTYLGGQDHGQLHGFFWSEEREALYFQFGRPYNASSLWWDRCVGAITFADGRTSTHGPWRTGVHSQAARNFMVRIPEGFYSQYLSADRRWGIGADMSSGYQASPHGVGLHAVSLPRPQTPADTISPDGGGSGTIAMPATTLVFHDIHHKMFRPGKHRPAEGPYGCGPYPLSPEEALTRPTSELWADEVDRTWNCTWIDLPDKHGVVWFGAYNKRVGGYLAPGDPEGIPHTGYGDPNGGAGGSGRPPKHCCHGQDDPSWGATGPFGHASVPHLFIMDPARFVPIIRGAESWSENPNEISELAPIVDLSEGHPSRRFERVGMGTTYFDAATRRLFVPIAAKDRGRSYYPQWAIGVFQVA